MTDESDETIGRQAAPKAVVGDVGASASRFKLAVGGLLTAVVCVTTIALVVWHATTPRTPGFQLAQGPSINQQIYRLSPDLQQRLAKAYSNPKRNLNQAYAKALALSIVGNQSAALKQMQGVINTGEAPYYMYEDFAYLKAMNSDYRGAILELQVARQRLQNDSSVDQINKKTQTGILDNKVAGYRQSE